MQRRESCNYTTIRFAEPDVPPHFKTISALGMRKLLSAYIADASDIYTFDDSHAAVAYPLAVVMHVGRQLVTCHGGANIDDDEIAFLSTECRDLNGRIPPLAGFFEAVRA